MPRNRGRSGFLDELAAMPWPVGAALGVIGFLLVRYGLPWWLLGRHDALARSSLGMFNTLSWLPLALCWMAALGSWLNSRHRQQLLDTRTDLDSLAAGGWRQFELLVGEAFRRQGYFVEETGLGGADGGIDLVLSKGGRRTLVQCKQWKRQQVGVSVVREMAGLLAHHHAHAVKIVCVGSFTRDAEAFAQGKPIELISGEQLLAMIRTVQRETASAPALTERIEPTLLPTSTSTADQPRSCPRCGSPMVERTNRRNGESFFGCTQFPRCRGTA